MFRWYLWDFDGTLFDSYPLMTRAMQQSLAALGVTKVEPQQIYRCLKISVRYALHYYSQKFSLTGLGPEFSRRERAAMAENAPFPQAVVLCRDIREAGCHNLLYTHRDKDALRMLARFSMLELFEDFVTSEGGFPAKPAPDAILYLIQKYGIPPQEALMVGDRPIDAEAGQNAGITGCLWDADGLFPDNTGWKIRRLEELHAVIPR